MKPSVSVLGALALAVALCTCATATAAPGARSDSQDRAAPGIRIPIPRLPVRVFKVRPPRMPVAPRRAPAPRATSRYRVDVELHVRVSELDAAQTSTEANATLRRIYFWGDRYEKLMVHAFCTGMDWLADQASDTRVSTLSWQAFFDGYLARFVRGYFEPRAVQVVDTWLSAFDMAKISPPIAFFYFRACYPR
jgi:hypothetical protein